LEVNDSVSAAGTGASFGASALAAVAAGSQGTRPVPVYWIGVGEKMEDLQPFVAADFAAALVG
jgi:signal recognition particle GTPase